MWVSHGCAWIGRSAISSGKNLLMALSWEWEALKKKQTVLQWADSAVDSSMFSQIFLRSAWSECWRYWHRSASHKAHSEVSFYFIYCCVKLNLHYSGGGGQFWKLAILPAYILGSIIKNTCFFLLKFFNIEMGSNESFQDCNSFIIKIHQIISICTCNWSIEFKDLYWAILDNSSIITDFVGLFGAIFEKIFQHYWTIGPKKLICLLVVLVFMDQIHVKLKIFWSIFKIWQRSVFFPRSLQSLPILSNYLRQLDATMYWVITFKE